MSPGSFYLAVMRQSLPEAMNELVIMTNCLGIPIEGREQRSYGTFLQIAMLVHTVQSLDTSTTGLRPKDIILWDYMALAQANPMGIE